MSLQLRSVPPRRAAGVAGVGAAIAAVIGLALPMIKDHEGLRTQAYRDPVGIPTICFGETLGVEMGDRATVAECEAMLQPRLEGFLREMRACTAVTLPAKTEAALLSFTYNLGTGVYCRNMAAPRINQGKFWEACAAMSLYTRARGRELPGLVRRRAEERALCEDGLREAGLPRT
ncbi:MAG: lysozyme [Gemmobacter sp.]